MTEHWYTYDAENRLKIHKGVLSGGRIQVASEYEDSYELLYDAAGREVMRYTWSPDGYGGQVDTVYRTAWDLRGNKLYEFHREYLGGESRGVDRSYRYDATGRLLETRSYYALDAEVEMPPDQEGMPRMPLRIGGWLKGAEQYGFDGDGRLQYQATYARYNPNWNEIRRQLEEGAALNQRTDLGVLDLRSRVDYSTAAGASGYDAAGRAWHYRYSGPVVGGGTHSYTTTFQGWESYRDRTVTGVSTDTRYKTTTNTLNYDGHGRLASQREHTNYDDGVLDDRIRYYAYTGDGAVQLRRSGTITDAGVFEQTEDS